MVSERGEIPWEQYQNGDRRIQSERYDEMGDSLGRGPYRWADEQKHGVLYILGQLPETPDAEIPARGAPGYHVRQITLADGEHQDLAVPADSLRNMISSGEILPTEVSADAGISTGDDAAVSTGIQDALASGCSPAEALDFVHVVQGSWTQSAWATVRGISQQTVSENVSKARSKIGGR